MRGKQSEIWKFFTAHNTYMNSRLVYATCKSCMSPKPSVDVVKWNEMSEEEKKKYAENSGWIVGKLEKLERHLAMCEASSLEAREFAKRLITERRDRPVVSRNSLQGAPANDVQPMVHHPIPLADALAEPPMPRHRSEEYLEWLQMARSVVRDAGARIVSLRHPVDPAATPGFRIAEKNGSTDLVTTADSASQEVVFATLKQAYPGHVFIGEEDESSHKPLTDEPTWIVDAIDGTTNFVHGLQEVSICVALALKGEVVIGVVFNPFRNELFHAVKGYGAFLNDRRISTSSTSSLKSAVVVCEWGYERSPSGIDAMLAAVKRLMLSNVRAVRQLGSGALDMCYVACGRIDAVYTGLAGEGWKIWDYAAASLIAGEAGAEVTDLLGQPFSLNAVSMACCAPGVASDLVAVVRPQL